MAMRAGASFAALLAAATALVPGPASGAEARGAASMTVDHSHVRRWNAFADAVVALHERQVKAHRVRTEESVGGYAGMPDFYREVRYFDAESGRLLSKVQYEREGPGEVHAIEVYVYGPDGRLLRDYAAAFLPGYRNAPVQTLVNLHHYNGGLHAFRQFDASGARIYEACEGTWQGRPVSIRLFEDDLHDTEGDGARVMASAEYRACFEGLPLTAGPHLRPR